MIKQRLLKEEILSDRERKNLRILELIGKRGPMTKTYISKFLKINIVTASNYVKHFINRGIVFETGLDASTGGRKPTLVDLNYKSGYVIGIALSYDFSTISAVLTDYGVDVVKKKVIDWDEKDRSKAVIEKIADTIESLITESDIDKEKIKGIGLALPGIIDERGETVKWGTSVGSTDIFVCLSVRSTLERRFRIPIFIERNDLVALAGEGWLNLSSNVQNVLFLNSAISCSYSVRGQLFRGTSGLAGYLGILSAGNKDIPQLAFEQNSFDLGICSEIKKQMKEGKETSLSSDKNITLDRVIDAAKEGDALSIQIIQKEGDAFGQKISFLVNLINPEVVIVGGGIEDLGPVLLDAIRKSVKRYALEETSNVVKIIPSTLGENLLCLGAASVVIQEIFSQI